MICSVVAKPNSGATCEPLRPTQIAKFKFDQLNSRFRRSRLVLSAGLLSKRKRYVPRSVFCCILFILTLAGCQSQAGESSAPIPTLAADPAAVPDLESAAQLAHHFLSAWKQQNFAQMHSLLTQRNQEATPLADFRALYQSAQNTMTFLALDYKAETLYAADGRVLVFQYEATFHTRILGSFRDRERRLHLVVDPEMGQWRVAWSQSDIFAELGNGGRLLFESQLPGRANIYDRDGEPLADQYGRMVRVWVDNARIPDRRACFDALAPAVDETVEEIADLFDNRSGPNWRVDAGIMEPQVFIQFSDRVEAACNAVFLQENTRRYLHGTLMPHVLGHVGYPDAEQIPQLAAQGYDTGAVTGKAGIEASWNETLAGRPGGRLSLVASNGARLRVLAEANAQIPKSLWLTIDSDLQENIVRVLDEAYSANTWGRVSFGASVVVMDVNDGEILAMVSYPSYEGNALNPYPSIGRDAADKMLEELANDERKPLINRPAQGVYPTGSVMKVLSAVAALDSGVYDDSTRFTCTGSWTYGFDTRYDWLPGGHGVMSVRTGITNSCNPFFYEVGFRLNAEDPYLLPYYAHRLGLGQPTGITAVPEVAGNIPNPDNVLQTTGLPWSYAFAVNLSIGQGEVQVTPLQIVRLYAAVANGGYLLRPQLVREAGLLDQRTRVSGRDVMRDTQIDPADLAIIQQGMCDVVGSRSGTAHFQFIYSPLLDVGVCGKTGTAQVAGEDELPHSWFLAYAPAQDPQIAIVTMVENAGEGSQVAVPLTRNILEYYFFGAF